MSDVVENINGLCRCVITSKNIDEGSFAACDHETVKYITFRARLSGTHENSSKHLVSLLTDWVSTRPVIEVMGVLMKVENAELNCSTQLSHFGEPNCFSIPEVDMDNTVNPLNPSGSDNFNVKNDTIAPIVGGVITGIFGIIAAVIAAIVPIYCCCKKKEKNGTVKQDGGTTDHTTTFNESCACDKREGEVEEAQSALSQLAESATHENAYEALTPPPLPFRQCQIGAPAAAGAASGRAEEGEGGGEGGGRGEGGAEGGTGEEEGMYELIPGEK